MSIYVYISTIKMYIVSIRCYGFLCFMKPLMSCVKLLIVTDSLLWLGLLKHAQLLRNDKNDKRSWNNALLSWQLKSCWEKMVSNPCMFIFKKLSKGRSGQVGIKQLIYSFCCYCLYFVFWRVLDYFWLLYKVKVNQQDIFYSWWHGRTCWFSSSFATHVLHPRKKWFLILLSSCCHSHPGLHNRRHITSKSIDTEVFKSAGRKPWLIFIQGRHLGFCCDYKVVIRSYNFWIKISRTPMFNDCPSL